MIVAVQGCCHGELDTIYDTIKKSRTAVDLLIICGDFQAIRNQHDLDQMAVPKTYQKMGNFYQYYNGSKIAPVPTVFIGGNHEASNYLHELFYGGWVCPNIYYLGCVGMINFMGLRIGGLSGIYKSFHYERGYYEKMPLTGDDIRSIYHVRKFTFMKAQLVREPVNIYMSHDWPLGIVNHGDKMKLLERKGFLKREIENNSLGSPPASDLLYKLKPQFFFSAHMHCKFQATVIHSPITTPNNPYGRPNEQQSNEMVNPEEIEICDTSDDEIEDLVPPEKKLKSNESQEPIITSFLALDKCGNKREFLELFKIDAPNECDNLIRLDREWLAITKTMSVFEPFCYTSKPVPSNDIILKEIQQNLNWVNENISDEMLIPPNFAISAPSYDPKNPDIGSESEVFQNQQTIEFCDLIGIECKINPAGQCPSQKPEKVETLDEAKARLLKLLGD